MLLLESSSPSAAAAAPATVGTVIAAMSVVGRSTHTDIWLSAVNEKKLERLRDSLGGYNPHRGP